MKYLAEQRCITVHEHSLQPQSHVTVNVTLEMPSPKIILTGTGGTTREIPAAITGSPSVSRETKYYFEDIPDEDVVTICQSYLLKMTEFVDECEGRFPKPQ